MIDTPYFEDDCDHPEDSFLGTAFAGDAGREPHDVYLYVDGGELTLCFRYGDEGSEYISPGPLQSCMQRLADGHHYAPMIRLARRVMTERLISSCMARCDAQGDILFGELAAVLALGLEPTE